MKESFTKQAAKVQYQKEQEMGVINGVTFDEWFEGKQLEMIGSFTISKQDVKIAKVAAVESDENDFSELIKIVNGLYPMKTIMRCINFLNKKNVGKVTKAELRMNNGDLVGIVWGTNGSYRLWQSVRISVKGREHLKMNVERV